MYLFGASGHGKVILDVLRACNVSVTAFIDADSSRGEHMGIKVIGEPAASVITEEVIISIGDNRARKRISEQFNFRYGLAVHPSALVSGSRLGEGTVVMHGAIIQIDSTVGRHVIINTGATIDHDCVIGDFVHIGPGASLCGHVEVGDCTLIGAGSVVIPGKKIGKNCIVGAGTVIVTDIPDGAVVAGNPGRIVKTNNL